MLAKIAPWVLLALAVFGLLEREKARAREAGRVEVLTEQRDSALTVLDSTRTEDSVRVVELQGIVDTAGSAAEALHVANDSLADELEEALANVPEPEIREVIRSVVDTLRAECDSCAVALEASKEQSAQLLLSWNNEKKEHDATRLLLGRVQGAKTQPIFHFDLTLGLTGLYDLKEQGFVVGPGVTAGVSICILCIFGG